LLSQRRTEFRESEAEAKGLEEGTKDFGGVADLAGRRDEILGKVGNGMSYRQNNKGESFDYFSN
jgi:hypothetical protein